MTQMPSRAEIEERWQCLDPVFIMGRQRTGTSIVWRALRVARFLGFPEGHLWFDLVEAFAHWHDPSYKESIRQEIFTVGSGRNLLLEKQFAVMMDQFHRDLLPSDLVRWVDKSPGAQAVRLAPMLAHLFPRSQFIFMQRNPITTVNSAVHYLLKRRGAAAMGPGSDESLHVFRATCEHWVRIMRLWRQVRPMLNGRYIEVPQEHIVEAPDRVSERLTRFLGIPQSANALTEVFRERRENTAFPDKDVGDFFYPVDWPDDQKALLAQACGEEMAIWGYPLDFQRPAGPTATHLPVNSAPMDMATYCRWLGEQSERTYHRELTECKDLLARISQGRVMRVLNAVDGWLHRLGLR